MELTEICRGVRAYRQCRINHGANGAAAPGPPHRGGPPHKVLKSRFIRLTLY